VTPPSALTDYASSTGSRTVTVTSSDRWEDVTVALQVVHDGFVEAGYMDPQPSGCRMISPYLNPGTIFFVAHIDGEAVGALALIPDGPFGLPSDRAFREELDAMRATGRPLFECGSLVVREEWRRHTRRVVAGLVAAAMKVFRQTLNANVVISVEPGQGGFYASMLSARPVAEPRPLFGAPALLLESTYDDMVDVMTESSSNGHRMLRELVFGPDEGWSVQRSTGEAWPAHEVGALLEEQGCLAGLLGQMRLVGAFLPALFGVA